MVQNNAPSFVVHILTLKNAHCNRFNSKRKVFYLTKITNASVDILSKFTKQYTNNCEAEKYRKLKDRMLKKPHL